MRTKDSGKTATQFISATRTPKRYRFFGRIVKQRRKVIAVFLALAVLCLCLKPLVAVNYDINDYLPSEAPSTIALDVMDEEFDTSIPNARIMIKDISIPEALEYKNKIAATDGVREVTWLDDVVDLSIPIDLQDQDIVSTYYQNNQALFSVSIDDSKRTEAVNDIRELIGDTNAMTGSAVSTAVATQSTVTEITIIAVLAVLFVWFVLMLTTTSWIEPVLVLFGLGVAVAINAGTNLIFGSISFVTNAAGSILQIAIALDFSVFLLHRYAECRTLSDKNNLTHPSTYLNLTTTEANMTEALCRTSTTIISSGCTVMMGFLALTVMQFQIGPDLGFALAKGIAISLITVFVFTPCLFVVCNRSIEKSQHRSFMPNLKKFSNVVAKTCVPLACVFLLLPIPAFMGSTSPDINYLYGSSHIFGSDTQLGSDTEEINNEFGKSDTYVLMVPKGDVAQEKNLSEALGNVSLVDGVISYSNQVGISIPADVLDKSTLSLLQSEHYSRLVITVDAEYEGQATFNLVNTIRSLAEEYYPGNWLLAGEGISTTDLMLSVTHDKEVVDVLAVVAVFVVLLLATRSLLLPILLVFVIETSIWCNFAAPYFTGQSEFYISYLIVSSIQLGVTVDYAILLSERYCENRRFFPRKEALRTTIQTVVIPICTSGIVLTIVGFVLSFVSTHGIISQLGHYLGVGVLLSLIAVIFVLPGFLYLFDKAIEKTTFHAHFFPDPKKGKTL